MYTVISSIIIILSIIVLVMETHPSAHVPLTKEHLAEYLELHPDDVDAKLDYIDFDNDTHVAELTGQKILASPTKPIYVMLDMFCTIFFTVEWLARLTFCPRKAKFFMRFLNILDLVAVLPFYVELVVHSINIQEKYEHNLLDKLFLLYILRIFRVFRLVRHSKGFQVLAYTLQASWREILLLLFCLTILMLIFGSLIYVAELGKTDTFQSIPHAFWWAVVTMTTVGYGDMYPTTDWGYFVGSMCAVSGVLVIAFTVPTMVNNFLLFYNSIQYQKKPIEPLITCEDAHELPDAQTLHNGNHDYSQELKGHANRSFTPNGSPKRAWEEVNSV